MPPGSRSRPASATSITTRRAKIPAEIDREIDANLAKLEKAAGKKLGDANNPLLVSVRSGAKFSMPGMMDTILNLGLNDETVEGLKAKTGNGRFAYDSYRRFIQMFGNVVLSIPKDEVRARVRGRQDRSAARRPTPISTRAACRKSSTRYKARREARDRQSRFPQDPVEQLRGARDAVFKSWMNQRAKEYRRIYDIPDHIGTAVNVQAMVFGNTGDRSATGVGFTRNPATGAQGVLRRVPRQRPGRGRRRRHPHAAADRRAREGAAEGVQGAAGRSRRGSSGTTRTCRTSSSRSKTRSSTCCRPGTASAPGMRPS